MCNAGYLCPLDWQDMGVGVQRHGDVCVAQALLCVFGLHACTSMMLAQV
jgi:hypothetical protein